MIEIGQVPGRVYNLDLEEKSVNLIRIMLQQDERLPIPDYNYGYYYAGKNHFTQRSGNCRLYQIFITHAGRGRLTVEGKEYFLEPNTICLLDLNVPQQYETAGSYWEYEWVNFCGYVSDYYYHAINPYGFTVYEIGDNHKLAELLGQVGDLASKIGTMEYIQTGSRILMLLDAMLNHVNEYPSPEPGCRENISAAIRYIDEHYAEKLTLDMMASEAYLSKFYFTRLFTCIKGMTPYKYLNTVRLSHARYLLLSTALSVDEISWQTGFGSGKNLIRTFKKVMGTTPDRYRRISGNENH